MEYKKAILPITIIVPTGDYCFDGKDKCPHFMGYGGGIRCYQHLGKLFWHNGLVKKSQQCQDLKESIVEV